MTGHEGTLSDVPNGQLEEAGLRGSMAINHEGMVFFRLVRKKTEINFWIWRIWRICTQMVGGV